MKWGDILFYLFLISVIISFLFSLITQMLSAQVHSNHWTDCSEFLDLCKGFKIQNNEL